LPTPKPVHFNQIFFYPPLNSINSVQEPHPGTKLYGYVKEGMCGVAAPLPDTSEHPVFPALKNFFSKTELYS
jgi:hypothetical protein